MFPKAEEVDPKNCLDNQGDSPSIFSSVPEQRCCWLALAEGLTGWTDAVNVKSQSFLRGTPSLPATLWC